MQMCSNKSINRVLCTGTANICVRLVVASAVRKNFTHTHMLAPRFGGSSGLSREGIYVEAHVEACDHTHTLTHTRENTPSVMATRSG